MPNKKLKIVLDTNILITSIPEKSEYRWIFDKFLDEEFDLCITNDILMEYEEIMERKTNPALKKLVIDLLLTADNVHKTFSYFKWNVINKDPDDNKFIDCAVASNADYIVTHDKHFNVLKTLSFPKINIVSVKEFKKLFKK